MKLLLWAALVFANGDAANETDKEHHTLLGDWKLVSLEIEGEKSSVPQEAKKDNGDFIRATIKPDKITLNYVLEGNAHTEELKYKVDNAKNPKWLDLKQPGQNIKGIYSVSKDTLKVCLTVMGESRPKEFASPKGSHRVLAVFERESIGK